MKNVSGIFVHLFGNLGHFLNPKKVNTTTQKPHLNLLFWGFVRVKSQWQFSFYILVRKPTSMPHAYSYLSLLITLHCYHPSSIVIMNFCVLLSLYMIHKVLRDFLGILELLLIHLVPVTQLFHP